MRLIDADALKKEVKTIFCPDGYKIMMLERIDNAPTVDMNTELSVAYLKGRRQGQADERPQGEWIIIKSPLSNETIVKCDKCGDEFIGNGVEDYNYCPNCGADMRKGGDESAIN